MIAGQQRTVLSPLSGWVQTASADGHLLFAAGAISPAKTRSHLIGSRHWARMPLPVEGDRTLYEKGDRSCGDNSPNAETQESAFGWLTRCSV